MYVPALPPPAVTTGVPTPTYDPIQLVECTRTVAARVLAGVYPFISFNAGRRWHRRIHRDRSIDIWLIGWLPSQGTELHDHGGPGAFTVVRGELAEACYAGNGSLRSGGIRPGAVSASVAGIFTMSATFPTHRRSVCTPTPGRWR